MSRNEPLDDLFRKALGRVEPPPAPELDWAMLAKAARHGKASTGVAGIFHRVHWIWKSLAVVTILAGGTFLATQIPGTSKEITTVDERFASEPATVTMPSVTTAPIIGQKAIHATKVAERTSITPRAVQLVTDERNKKGSAAVDAHANGPVRRTDATDMARAAVDRAANAGSHARLPRGKASSGPLSMAQPPNSTNVERDPPVVLGVAIPWQEDGSRGPANAEMAPEDEISSMNILWMSADRLSREPAAAIDVNGTAAVLPFARWAVSPWLSMDHTSYHDQRISNDVALDQLSADRGWTGGLGFRAQYVVKRWLAIGTGIGFVRSGKLTGTIRTSASKYTDYHLSGDRLQIPLSLTCLKPLENKELYLRLGMIAELNVHNGSDEVVLHDLAAKQVSTLALSTSSMGAALDFAAGVNFRLRRGLGLFLEPSYRLGLKPMMKHPSFDSFPFNPKVNTLSLGVGLCFTFHSR